MKKITILFAFFFALSTIKAQLTNGFGLEGVYVEKYYLTDAADSTNAADNAATTNLRIGSTTYRVFLDLAPDWRFNTMFGSTTVSGTNTIVHPLIFQTTTDFYNDPIYGQVYPQNISLTNTRKNTTMIDSWLSVGGVCFGKMGIPKTEDPDGSVGNANGVLQNNPGGLYGAPINSVNPNAKDGLMPGSPLSPISLGTGTATDIFDQTPGSVLSLTDAVISGLGGVVGTTTTNMVLIGQFTTKGVFSFSLNIQLQNVVTSATEVYVPANAFGSEFTYTALGYSSGVPPTNTVTPGDSNNVGINRLNMNSSLSVYPNPSKGVFTINATNLKESANNFYNLYDLTGRLLFTRPMRTTSTEVLETVDISNMVDGLYFLNISIDGMLISKKLVKQ